ncbi:MAG TPA: hypothetical protein VK771_07240, partial [Acidimicrobiia bacterium]|nr:hypothetical protein [Acidimicrobiia bacterium]
GRLVEPTFRGRGGVGRRSSPTVLAGQVARVPDERFGEFEAGRVAGAGRAADHTFSFEDGEVAVGTTRTFPR